MTCCASTLPAEITAGLDFRAAVDLRDYPATEWTARVLLRGPKSIDLTATASGTAHAFAADAATTAAWTPGAYWYSLRVSKDSNVLEADKGQMSVLPDLEAMQDGFDGRTQNQIALDAINAVLAKRATLDQQRYVIDKRELWRTPIADLLKLRAFYTTAVRRERNRASGCSGFGRQIPVRFS